MSSISRRQRAALRRFFRRRLLPLANDPRLMTYDDKTASRSASSSDAGASGEGRDTYFVAKFRPPVGPEDFCVGLADEAQIEETLATTWRGSPLEGIARPLVRLSRLFRDVEEKDEVSSSVYEMF